MLGHEYVLSETNTHSWVFVCECGEIGTVQTRAGFDPSDTLRARAITEIVKDRARADHARHLELVRDETARAHAVALDAHAAYVGAVRPTLTRLGRWGNG